MDRVGLPMSPAMIGLAMSTAVLGFAVLALVRQSDASVLSKLVDVKGNGAIREVRMLYDLYGNEEIEMNPMPIVEDSPMFPYGRKINLSKAIYKSSSLYPWQQVFRNQESKSHESKAGAFEQENKIADLHPQRILEQSKTKLSQAGRLKMKNVSPHFLIRGRPLFAEIDFVPKYIPQLTYHVAVSVTLPAHIRGRPWILGWHQEVFPLPPCRLCTNNEQSYTLPVTLFLPDDGWCPEGRVPTIWKIEAIPRDVASRMIDQTDMVLAYGYDELRQVFIGNDPNATIHCRGINEAIVA